MRPARVLESWSFSRGRARPYVVCLCHIICNRFSAPHPNSLSVSILKCKQEVQLYLAYLVVCLHHLHTFEMDILIYDHPQCLQLYTRFIISILANANIHNEKHGVTAPDCLQAKQLNQSDSQLSDTAGW